MSPTRQPPGPSARPADSPCPPDPPREGAAEPPAQAPQPGTYEHYKGASYRVIDLVRHSETEEWLVLYRPLHGEGGLWVRPVGMFAETVSTATGPRPRFRRTGD